MRRGKQTLHLQFSERKALLLCHDVMKMVYLIWIEHCPPHVDITVWNHIMRTTLYRLTVGQYYDMEKKGTLIELASLKTGILFGCVGEIVGYWTGLDHHFWREWGNRMGILFQWVDDWHDREEDELQCNRNAFNEDHDVTIYQYQMLWSDLCKSIGRPWFHTPFGKYMKEYFTSISILAESETTLVSLTSFPHFDPLYRSFLLPNTTYMKKKILSTGLTQHIDITENLIHSLLRLFETTQELEPLQTNLWDIPEREWDDVEEIKNVLERVQTGIE
jgi:hypothetical protein